MPDDILSVLGPLFLGSRLKRLSERMQGDAAKIIRAAGLPIQPAQFPLLAALDRYGPLTVGETVETLGLSQPSVTRLAGGLVKLGLVGVTRDGADLRHRTLALTEAGAEVIARGKHAVWPAVSAAVTGLCDGLSGPLLDQIAELEARLEQASLEQRARDARASDTPVLAIRDYDDALAESFYRINAEWIESMFSLEENDRLILSQPRELIVDRGGVILFVESGDLGVIGTCALMKIDQGCFELTKMAVSAAARGRKAGEFLLRATLDRAEAMGIETLYLLTNRKCAAAIHLYEKAGFVHDDAIMRRFASRYERCNVAMRYAPGGG